MQGESLVKGVTDIPQFDREALIHCLRVNQAGESTFPEFLQSAWEAGVIRYDVDFIKRHVIYYGCNEESYLEEYPEIEVK
jgi:uncharacterized protein YbcV (DUF1398 family)